VLLCKQYRAYPLDNKTAEAVTDENNRAVFAILCIIQRLVVLLSRGEEINSLSSLGQGRIAVYEQLLAVAA
jgi:hypothetical protein